MPSLLYFSLHRIVLGKFLFFLLTDLFLEVVLKE